MGQALGKDFLHEQSHLMFFKTPHGVGITANATLQTGSRNLEQIGNFLVITEPVKSVADFVPRMPLGPRLGC